MKNSIGRAFRAVFGIKIRLWAVILALLLCFGLTYGLTVRGERGRIGSEENYTQAMKYLEIKNALDTYYVGAVDEEAVSSAAFAAMVSGLGDEWSYYMSPSEYSAYKLYASNQYVGLGVSVDKDVETGGLRVTGVYAGSPAETAGIEIGCVILSINGTDITDMTVGDARSFLDANVSESVKVTMLNADGDQTELNVNCALVYQSPVTYSLESGNVGYVQILNFDSGSAAAAMDAIEKLLSQGALGFVFDLRSNPGGLLSELTELLDYLLPSGTIFISVDKSGEQTAIESDSVCLDMPMAVIVNEYTYSAAEFFAAALQDYNWAEIIGVRTTGKSRSQQTVERSDGRAIQLATATYLTPRGVDLAEQGGVIPDQEVAITSSGDSQLSAALMAVQWNM